MMDGSRIGIRTAEGVAYDSLIAQMTPQGLRRVIWGWPRPDPDFIFSVMTSGQFVDGGGSDSGTDPA
jgi:hypothetical protein